MKYRMSLWILLMTLFHLGILIVRNNLRKISNARGRRQCINWRDKEMIDRNWSRKSSQLDVNWGPSWKRIRNWKMYVNSVKRYEKKNLVHVLQCNSWTIPIRTLISGGGGDPNKQNLDLIRLHYLIHVWSD